MRLIDADAMRQDWLENGENEYVYDTNAFLDSIDEQPTIDAVPVVRCKDCEHFRDYTDRHFIRWTYCIMRSKPVETDPDDYCSYGERKDGDG